MSTWDLLIDRGWLMAWWMLVPAGAMVGIWVLAILGDRHPDGPARVSGRDRAQTR